jgi:hypothetical protein
MEENKQVVAEWKALNQPRLQEIKSANPELYSAVNLALQYLNQKLGGDELPEEVEQEVEEEVVVETTPVETKQWTFADFQNIKIVVDTPEKSRKFQELFFSLGGEWSQLDSKVSKSVDNLDKIYLVTSPKLLYVNTYKTFEELTVNEIFYEDIFPEETIANPLTLEELKGTYVYLDTEDLREEYQKIVFDLGGEWILTTKKVVDPSFGPYFVVNKFGQMRYFKDSADMPSYQLKNITKEWPEMRKRYVPTSLTPTQTPTKTGVKWRMKTKEEFDAEGIVTFTDFGSIDPTFVYANYAGKYLEDIYDSTQIDSIQDAESRIGQSGLSLNKGYNMSKAKYWTQKPLPQIATSTPQNGYTLPIETYPALFSFKIPGFSANTGNRQSPTQSAGELKRWFSGLSSSEQTRYAIEIDRARFKGNDGKWYAIKIGRGGVWTWKETTPPPTQRASGSASGSGMGSGQSSSFTSTATPQTQLPVATKTWRPEDLVGKKLLWSGREYDVVSFRRNNPKYKSYNLKSATGTEVEGKLTMGAINNLLNDVPVKGISIIKQTQTSSSNSFEDSIRFLSDVELKKLYDETDEARKEFSSKEPEYLELTSQIVAIGNEMDKRNI